jgi:hypothetical protein
MIVQKQFLHCANTADVLEKPSGDNGHHKYSKSNPTAFNTLTLTSNIWSHVTTFSTVPLFNYKCEHRYSKMFVLWRLDWMHRIRETLDDGGLTFHLTWAIQIKKLGFMRQEMAVLGKIIPLLNNNHQSWRGRYTVQHNNRKKEPGIPDRQSRESKELASPCRYNQRQRHARRRRGPDVANLHGW